MTQETIPFSRLPFTFDSLEVDILSRGLKGWTLTYDQYPNAWTVVWVDAKGNARAVGIGNTKADAVIDCLKNMGKTVLLSEAIKNLSDLGAG